MSDWAAKEIDTWIAEAVRDKRLLVRRLSEEDARIVQERAMARYVKTTNDPGIWWLNLARPIDEHYDRNAVRMAEVLPQKHGPVFLIPECLGSPLVYEVEASQLEALIDNCPGFEYNVVPLDLSWLFLETHHDMFYVCRASDALPALMTDN